MTGLIQGRRWVVSPYMGIGSLSFGMPRADARSHFAETAEEFRGSRASSVSADHFPEASVQLFYDEDEKLVRVKLFSPAEVFVSGVELLGMPWKEARRALGKIDRNRFDVFGLEVYRDLGIGLMEDDGKVWSVEAFVTGLYDHYLPA